jgi:hypothetical protein
MNQSQNINQYQSLLDPYKYRIISDLTNLINLEDKIVLDIGGSNLPNDVVFNGLRAKKWVCVDKFWPVHTEANPEHYLRNPIYNFSDIRLPEAMKRHDYIIFNEYAENIGSDFLNMFDVCISICAFEHIQSLLAALNNIYDSLNTHGFFFTEFGPIWSSCGGSHFWINDDLNFNNRGPIPDHAHLLLSYAEILKIFMSIFPAREAESYAYSLYTGNRCDANHFFYEDYESILAMSKFQDYQVSPSYCSPISERELANLQAKYHPYKRFDVWEIRISGRKHR